MKIKMRLLTIILVLLLLCNALVIPVYADESEEVIDCTFMYTCQSSLTGTVYDLLKEADVQWMDSFFNSDSSVYNHDLSRVMSLLSAGAYYGATSKTSNLTHNYNELGFSYVVHNYKPSGVSYDSDSEFYDENGNAYAIAQKVVKFGDDEVTLISVIARGTTSEEWIGNFNIGTGDKHESFDIASNMVLDALNDYVTDYCNTEKIKIFITGHSRGAAVANALAAKLNMAGECGSRTITKNDVFAYTYACPTVTMSEDAHSEDFNNIFNIVLPNDIVGCIPFTPWGYSRYGVDLAFPDITTNNDYSEIINQLNEVFTNKTVMNKYVTYPGGNADIINFTSDCTSLVPSPLEFYSKTYTLNGQQKTTNELLSTILDIIAGSVDSKITALTTLASALSTPFGLLTNFLLTNAFSQEGMGAVMQNHAPETYVSFMLALDEECINTPKLTKKISITKDTHVLVYDASSLEEIAEITNGENISFKNTGAIKTTNEYVEIYLPNDGNYVIEISDIPNNKIDIAYSLLDFKGEVENAMTYSNIYVSNNNTLTIEAYELVKQISLTDGTKKEIAPTYNSFDEVSLENVFINLNAVGNGDAVSNSKYAKGSIAKVYAYEIQKSKEKFAGWDINGYHKSDSEKFSFITDKSIDLTCVFIDPETITLGDCNDDDEITMQDVVLIQKYIAKLDSLSTRGVHSADVDDDKELTMMDVYSMQLYIADLKDSFV